MAGVSPVMLASVGAGLANAHTINQFNKARGNAAGEYQTRIAELNAQSAAEESDRKAALARNSAQQRARFAASGITPSEGSSAAVLDGLKSMTDADAEQRARQFDLARQRAALSYSAAPNTDLLSLIPRLYQDNLGKLRTWEN